MGPKRVKMTAIKMLITVTDNIDGDDVNGDDVNGDDVNGDDFNGDDDDCEDGGKNGFDVGCLGGGSQGQNTLPASNCTAGYRSAISIVQFIILRNTHSIVE